MPDTAAGIPYEGTDCTSDEAVEAVEAVRATAARDEVLLRVISRHGTPTHHTMRDGQRCTCWTEAKRVLKDLHQAGYVLVKEFDRG